MSGIDDLVDAIDETTEDGPTGADWQMGTVSAVGSGLVDVDIPSGTVPDVRCLASYTSPTIGDVVRLDRNSTGNWCCPGKFA